MNEHSPDEPLDVEDLALLRDLGTVLRTVDPVPAGLVDDSLFALTLEGLKAQVMEARELGTAELAVRGGSDALDRETVQARTITFSCDPVTVMVTLSESPTGGLCVDGWIAPPGRFAVELYRPGSERVRVESDEDGAFVLLDVPHGRACLALRRADDTGPTVCTPVIEL